jgi:hypothetical protein
MTQRYQKSEWGPGTKHPNEPTPRTIRRALKENEQMKKKIIRERYVGTHRTAFDFADRSDITRAILSVQDAMGPERRSEFMVFAFGVFQYYGKVRGIRELQPEHFDDVGFAFMEKLIELRKTQAAVAATSTRATGGTGTRRAHA